MDEVSKTAHSVKSRLELLHQGNQAALERKASSTLLHTTDIKCAVQFMLRSELEALPAPVAATALQQLLSEQQKNQLLPCCVNHCCIALLLHKWVGLSYVVASPHGLNWCTSAGLYDGAAELQGCISHTVALFL